MYRACLHTLGVCAGVGRDRCEQVQNVCAHLGDVCWHWQGQMCTERVCTPRGCVLVLAQTDVSVYRECVHTWECLLVLARTDVSVYRACVHTWGCVLVLIGTDVYRTCVHTWGCVLMLFCNRQIRGPLRRAALRPC